MLDIMNSVKTTEHKVKVQKTIVFLYTNNEQSKNEINILYYYKNSKILRNVLHKRVFLTKE